ncbi:type VII secretion target, partial [Mycolicibacterium vaccae]
MTQPLSVDPGAVRSLGEVHQRVAGELGALSAAPPGSVAQSHGTIAAAVDAALTGALGARSDTMATTHAAGDTISELLRQAALAYERGDDRGAEAIRAAADHMA